MDEDNCEHFGYVDGQAQYPCPINPGMLEIERVYLPELEEMYFEQDEDLDTFTVAGETFVFDKLKVDHRAKKRQAKN